MNQTITVFGERESRAREELRPLEAEAARIIEKTWHIYFPLYNDIFFVAFRDKAELGCFVLPDRLILLSENLIDEEPDIIRNVFLHEMAHAVNYALNGSVSHDSAFRLYCRILGAEEGFDKARVSLNISKKERMKEKIEKLMALSSSPYENEAAVALDKARKLLLENGEKEEREEDKIYQVNLYEARRMPSFALELGTFTGLITGSFVVKVLDGGLTTIRALGTIDQTESSLYLFNTLLSSVEKEVSALRRKGYQITKNDFVSGAIPEMKRKLRCADTEAEKAIEIVRNENREKANRLVFSSFTSRKMRSERSVDPRSFTMGREYGKSVNVSSVIGRKEIK